MTSTVNGVNIYVLRDKWCKGSKINKEINGVKAYTHRYKWYIKTRR